MLTDLCEECFSILYSHPGVSNVLSSPWLEDYCLLTRNFLQTCCEEGSSNITGWAGRLRGGHPDGDYSWGAHNQGLQAEIGRAGSCSITKLHCEAGPARDSWRWSAAGSGGSLGLLVTHRGAGREGCLGLRQTVGNGSREWKGFNGKEMTCYAFLIWVETLSQDS